MREWKIHYDHELEKDNAWILGTIDNDKYKESRSKVIGKAIGDCVAGKNEFKDKSAGLAGNVLKPFEMDVKPVTKQSAEPVILPRQTKEGGTFTKHGFVPRIKMPVKKVTYGYVTKWHKQKPLTPQPEKAMFMRTYVVRVVVAKKPNFGCS